MPTLPVASLPAGDAGRLLVRLNHVHRSGIKRFGIARLTNEANGLFQHVLVLGHEDPTVIYMPFDIRTGLGAVKGKTLSFSITAVGPLGKLRWYVGSRDPAVHLPAWLTLLGLGLGILGIVLGGLPLLRG